jgi:hypothetical protein
MEKNKPDGFEKFVELIKLWVLLVLTVGGSLWLIDKLVKVIAHSPLQHL